MSVQTSPAFDLLQLFGREQLNDIQNRLSRITQLGFITVNYRGEPLTDYTGFCDFCSHFRNDPELRKNCETSDAMSSIQAAVSEKPLIYMCPCGLMEIAIPIVVEGVYLGGFLGGQALCSDPPADIQKMRSSTDGPAFRETVRTASRDIDKLPVFSYEHFEQIADLVNLIITLLCESKMNLIRQEQGIRREERRNALLDEEIREMARLLGGPDYPALMEAVPGLVRRLREVNGDRTEEEMETLAVLADRLEVLPGMKEIPDRKSLYPLRTADVENEAAEILWIEKVLDYYFRMRVGRKAAILEPVFSVINQNMSEPLSLARLVEECRISQSYLSRLFQKNLGVTVTDYIHLRKIRQARELICAGQKSVPEIAFSLGYNEYTYFSKVFKKYTGGTVQEYRRSLPGTDTQTI